MSDTRLSTTWITAIVNVSIYSMKALSCKPNKNKDGMGALRPSVPAFSVK